MNNRIRWRISALTSAIALLGGLASLDAHALALGRITVQSALGEPLRAEIDIAEITAEEAGSLRAGVASVDAFKAAGLEYTPAVAGLQVTLQKRADGRSFLRLSSTRPVSEPFVDLVLDASWSSGRVVRDYTMLFDPPSLRQPAPPTAPIFSRPLAPSAAGISATPYSPPPAAASRSQSAPSRPSAVARAPVERVVPVPRPAAGGEQVTVKQGDTAGRIAARNKPASISLDQMLVAMLRGNPDAFIGGNINRLKSGAVLSIPDAGQAGAIPPAEASRTIVAQSRDFNDFRRKLAEGVPATQVGNANRQAGGKVQAKVEDRAPATAVPDKLTLSKGAVQGKPAKEDKIAKDLQAKEASDRVAELTKNIGDLSKLAAPAAPATTASAGTTPGVAVTAPVAVPAAPAAASATPASGTVPPTAMAASSPASQTVAAAAGVASTPAATPPKKPVVVPPPPSAEPDLIDELTGNSLILGGIAALVILLGAFGLYRMRRKRNNALAVDSSFLESRLQPDSFFGASGGQRIDTNEGGATGSSLVYSPSQLDAAGDVDPVAEADVYLAYGRDLQAEEILREAMRTSPTRVAIHAKLMEIYAKRRDAKAFEVLAVDAFNLTHGDGPDWAYIGEMGRELDPSNPLYQPGGQPSARGVLAADSSHSALGGFGSSTIPQILNPEPQEVAAPVDFDLDLDFSLGDEPKAAHLAVPESSSPVVTKSAFTPEPTIAMQVPQDPIFEGLGMDFSTDTVILQPDETAVTMGKEPDLDLGASALSASGLSFSSEPVPKAAQPAAASAKVVDNGMLEFDMGSLSLDLGGPTTESPGMTTASGSLPPVDDPLETKFALAEEFRALGDTDGARELAEEVISHASGSLKTRAQAFINGLA
jgi:pilus assembly protein FimV